MSAALPRLCLVQASNQNVFFAEMLEAIGEALESRGHEVVRSYDCFPRPEEDLVYLYVPHEYHPLVWPDAAPTPVQRKRTVALCTEQPGTQWFEEAAAIAAECGAAIDINELGVRELRRRGVDARFMRLGYVPSWDHWHGDESVERPIDVTFQGGYTARRAQALARCAPVLTERTSSLHVFETHMPHKADDPHFLSGARKWEALRRSKVIVNVHRQPLAYVEWQRLVGAMANGCVVLTEHCLGFDPLVPNEHFVAAAFDHLQDALDALLRDPAGLADIRQAAYALWRDRHPLSESVGVLSETLSELAAEPLVRRLVEHPTPFPRPKPAAPPRLPYDKQDALPSDDEMMRAALKQLVLEQRQLKRALARLQASDAEDRVVDSPAFASADPRVSVVVTVYNYADVVGEAIRSVAASDCERLELIVVDDASGDDSIAAVERALRRVPWLPARLIARAQNGGLGAARNTAIAAARGEYVFILDADNMVYPRAFSKLAAALDDHPEAAFAYPILEAFDDAGPRDLISWLGWDTDRLRFGNFVDAMAMMRREVVLEVGGYTTDHTIYGWEDFDLWCSFADRGLRGQLVPEMLGRYRQALHSMIQITNIDVSAVWTALLARHPSLRERAVAAR